MLDPALQGVLVGALIGFIGSAFTALVTHRLSEVRDRRRIERAAEVERVELLAIVPVRDYDEYGDMRKPVGWQQLSMSTEWSTAKLRLRLDELLSDGRVYRFEDSASGHRGYHRTR